MVLILLQLHMDLDVAILLRHIYSIRSYL